MGKARRQIRLAFSLGRPVETVGEGRGYGWRGKRKERKDGKQRA